MKPSVLNFVISFVTIYLALAVQLLTDKAPASDYLTAILIALTGTVLSEMVSKYIEQKKKKKNSE